MDKTAIRIYEPGKVHDEETSSLSFGAARKRIGGWVEVHSMGDLVVFCDEEGRLKQMEPSVNIGGTVFVGPVLLGKMSEEGDLMGVPPQALNEFERKYSVQCL